MEKEEERRFDGFDFDNEDSTISSDMLLGDRAFMHTNRSSVVLTLSSNEVILMLLEWVKPGDSLLVPIAAVFSEQLCLFVFLLWISLLLHTVSLICAKLVSTFFSDAVHIRRRRFKALLLLLLLFVFFLLLPLHVLLLILLGGGSDSDNRSCGGGEKSCQLFVVV